MIRGKDICAVKSMSHTACHRKHLRIIVRCCTVLTMKTQANKSFEQKRDCQNRKQEALQNSTKMLRTKEIVIPFTVDSSTAANKL